ncbi:MAG: ATP-binding protein [Anaerolineales bacterium]|jgi:signal transduction histidine kinase
MASSKNPQHNLSIEPLDLGELLAGVIRDLTPIAAQKEQQLVYSPPVKPLLIDSNSDGLRTIFSNLLDNAIKYTPPGGRITLHVYAQDETIEVRVRDTGIGISPELMPHLGEEFFRTPNARHSGSPGTGLGLSIVKQMLQRLGSRMDVESKLNSGTTVTVWVADNRDGLEPN